MHRLTHSAPLITLALVALIAAAPLWGPGMVNTRGGGDSPFLLQRTHQLVANLRAGVFPARWMPDAAYGLGYPFFNYYAALPYYLAAALVLLGLDILTALKLVQTLGFLLAALTMYGWVRHLTGSRRAAWLAGFAYTVVPFHLVNVYVRGDSLSEFYAFAFYPLLLRALDALADGEGGTKAALAYAGLLLTHNLSAFIFSPFAGLYLIALTWHRRRWRVLRDGLLSLGLGFLLSAWFWLPAVLELRYVQLGPSTAGYFHYSHHFRSDDLVQEGFLFDYDVKPGGNTAFAMHWPQAGLAALGWAGLLLRGLRRRLDPRHLFLLLGFPLAPLMITPYSRFLWDHLPLLPVVQFPWRFLSVQALFTAALTAYLAAADRPHAAPLFGVSFLVVLALLALPLVSLFVAPPDRLPITPADITTARLRLYELFTGNIGTTIRYEWLPRTANPRPFTSDLLIEPNAPPRAIPLAGAEIGAVLVERGPVRQRWRTWGDGGDLAFPLLYWPGWQARIDDEPTAAYPVPGSGYLAVSLPPGDHTVTLRLGHTLVRALAEAISLAAVLFVVVKWGASLQVASLQVASGQVAGEQVGRRLLTVSAALLAFVTVLLLLALIPRLSPPPPAAPLVMDFARMPYLHPAPDGVPVGDGLLLTYTLAADVLAPGDPLTVALTWAGDAPSATLRLVSPAAVRHPELEPLAETSVRTPTLRLPADLPRGLYLIQLGHQYLRPVRVRRGPALPPQTPILAPFGPDIRLHTATISQTAPHRLAVHLVWSTERALAVNYGISLRLLDAAGQLRVVQDTWPGYGFAPTSLWRPGETIADRYTLSLPDTLPTGTYRLRVILYRMEDAAPIGQVQVGDFTLPLTAPFTARPAPRRFSLPALSHPVDVEFGGLVRLAGYDLVPAADALHLTLWWQATDRPPADYTVFVHLFDPATETIVAQHDSGPRDGTYPTSWWRPGEVVSDTVTLSLSSVPPGDYRLAVGLYDAALTRLPARAADGPPLPGDRYILPEEIAR